MKKLIVIIASFSFLFSLNFIFKIFMKTNDFVWVLRDFEEKEEMIFSPSPGLFISSVEINNYFNEDEIIINSHRYGFLRKGEKILLKDVHSSYYYSKFSSPTFADSLLSLDDVIDHFKKYKWAVLKDSVEIGEIHFFKSSSRKGSYLEKFIQVKWKNGNDHKDLFLDVQSYNGLILFIFLDRRNGLKSVIFPILQFSEDTIVLSRYSGFHNSEDMLVLSKIGPVLSPP